MQSVAYLFLVARKQFLKLLDSGRSYAESPTSVSLFRQNDETPLRQESLSRVVVFISIMLSYFRESF